jgi:LacI family transcriptional regulator
MTLRAPTIRDVAAHAQVSICTVSRVLAGGALRERYTGDTQGRVERAAQALGYVPSHRARALQAKRASAIGVLTPIASDVFIAALIAGVDGAIREHRRHTVLLSADGEAKVADALRALDQGSIDGVLVVPYAIRQEDIARLEASRHPVVLLGPAFQSGLPRVWVDPAPGIAAAVRHCAELGHRRIAWLSPEDDRALEWRPRADAVAAAASRMGVALTRWVMPSAPPPTEEWICCAHDTVLAGLDAPEPPTAVLCYNDLAALGVYAAAAERGLRVGRDLSVIGFDDVHSRTTYPMLSSVSQMHAEASVEALELLLDESRRRDSATNRRVVHAEFLARASIGPPPARHRA